MKKTVLFSLFLGSLLILNGKDRIQYSILKNEFKITIGKNEVFLPDSIWEFNNNRLQCLKFNARDGLLLELYEINEDALVYASFPIKCSHPITGRIHDYDVSNSLLAFSIDNGYAENEVFLVTLEDNKMQKIFTDFGFIESIKILEGNVYINTDIYPLIVYNIAMNKIIAPPNQHKFLYLNEKNIIGAFLLINKDTKSTLQLLQDPTVSTSIDGYIPLGRYITATQSLPFYQMEFIPNKNILKKITILEFNPCTTKIEVVSEIENTDLDTIFVENMVIDKFNSMYVFIMKTHNDEFVPCKLIEYGLSERNKGYLREDYEKYIDLL
ncbi:MAG: hypothetical protein HYV28_16260 [Ignavibacteriales bacterium]|nr:hypothetical protein [Ignavibacteriales bacterium]